jgi:WD40 repeat protein
MASAAALPSYFRYVTDAEREAYARTVVLWDAGTGTRLGELQAPHPVSCIAFSPDGRRLAAAYEGGIVLFDCETGKQSHQLIVQFDCGIGKSVSRLQFSMNGKQVYVSERDGGVTLQEIDSGKRLRRWKAAGGRDTWLKEREHVLESIPSPDGRFIAWRLWRAPDYSKLPAGVRPPPPRIRHTVLVVTDSVTEKPLYRLEATTGAFRSFVFSHDSKRFAVIDDRVHLHDAATGKKLFTVGDSSAWRIALSANGSQAVIADGGSRVQLWDLKNRNAGRQLCSGLMYVNTGTLESPQAFSADGKSLLLVTNWSLRLFDTTTGKERGAPTHRTPITPRFSADGQTLHTTCHEFRCRWSVAPGKKPVLLGREVRNVWEGVCGTQALAHSADGRLFVDDQFPGKVRLRETKTGRVLHHLDDDRRSVSFGLFSPDATRLLLHRYKINSNEPEVYRLYDTRTGKRSGEFKRGEDVERPVFSPDGRFVAWSDRACSVHLQDAMTGKFVQTLRSPSLPRASCNDAHLIFSPDSEYLAITCYKGHYTWEDQERLTHPTRIFHLRSGKETARFHADPRKETDAARHSCWAWSPDNRLLAIADQESGKIRLIEIASGRVRASLTGHSYGVRGLAFSPDGRTLASGGEDNVVFLWDVTGARTRSTPKPARKLDLAAWWKDLLAPDAERAGTAVTSFLLNPRQSENFLCKQMRPREAPGRKRLTRLIADLTADSFEARESAQAELERLGEQAETALRSALKNKPDLEAARRINRLVAHLERGPSQQTLRALRVIEVLEYLATPAAVRRLELLAKGDARARQTISAKEALRRLARR